MGGARLAALLLLLGAVHSGRAGDLADDGSSAATVAAMMSRRLQWTWGGAPLRGLANQTVDGATANKTNVTDSRGGAGNGDPDDAEPDSYKPGEPGGEGAPCRINLECVSGRCQLYQCAAPVDTEAVDSATETAGEIVANITANITAAKGKAEA